MAGTIAYGSGWPFDVVPNGAEPRPAPPGRADIWKGLEALE